MNTPIKSLDAAARVRHVAATAEGLYLRSEGETCFSTMDGSDVAAWAERQGFEVVGYRDTGRNGLCDVIVDGVPLCISTNGHVSRPEGR